MPKLRVHNFAISVDGYGAGPDQSVDDPLGVGGKQLHEWAFASRAWREMHGEDAGDGADASLDDAFITAGDAGIGATIMGRNMFGPVRGPWGDEAWTGWWGEDPPYHHPVFVLTHHPQPPIEMQGGTTFHFVGTGIEDALARAFDAAAGDDVRLAGGVSRSSSTSEPASSTRCTSRSRRCCSGGANVSSTTSTAARRATNAWSS